MQIEGGKTGDRDFVIVGLDKSLMINKIARFKNTNLLSSDPTKVNVPFSNDLLVINDNNEKIN